VPHHKDAIKRLKQNEKRRARNRHYRSRMRNQIKKVRNAVAEGNVEVAQVELRTAMSVIHRVASKGVIHRNQAARRISRLNKAVKKIALGA
jgi:small subunit ribosomal protein S20